MSAKAIELPLPLGGGEALGAGAAAFALGVFLAIMPAIAADVPAIKAIPVTVLEVTDGDTFKIPVFDGSSLLMAECYAKRKKRSELSVRVFGVDTPESKKPPAKCESEVALGKKAKAFTARRIKAGDTVWLSHVPGEKYQCRFDFTVYYGPGQRDLAADLIRAGLARSYFGETKGDWCDGSRK